MPSASVLVATLGGVATREQIVAGSSASELAAALRAGELTRVRRAHYASPAASREAVIAARVGGALCGLSAARSFGLWSGFDDRLHIALPPNASRSRVHRDGDRWMSDGDPMEIVRHWIPTGRRRQCWRVDLDECLKQAVAWSDEETGIAVLDTARSKFGITERELRVVFAGESSRSLLRVGRSRAGSESGLESIVRQRLTPLGYRLAQQVRLRGVGRVDLHVLGTRVFIEIDGREHHGSAAAFTEDRRRDAEAARSGAVVLRFTYPQIVADWPWCEQIIRSAALRFQEIV